MTDLQMLPLPKWTAPVVTCLTEAFLLILTFGYHFAGIGSVQSRRLSTNK